MTLEALKDPVLDLLNNSSHSVTERLNEVCAYLQKSVSYYDWVGFYFADFPTKTLHLKAFAGEPTDHVAIPFGKGICGQVAVSNANFIVPDVTAQDNYISCSVHVKSEIVVPLFKDGKNVGQIDIDSHYIEAFSEKDEDFLEWVNQQVAKILISDAQGNLSF